MNIHACEFTRRYFDTRFYNISLTKVIMQGKLIAVAYTLRTC